MLQQWGCDQVQGFLIGKPTELCDVAGVEAVI
jgi:EAL domain-containing protein (putative c-di-GMP-specific phosphodiesterase class I)